MMHRMHRNWLPEAGGWLPAWRGFVPEGGDFWYVFRKLKSKLYVSSPCSDYQKAKRGSGP